VWGVRPSDPAPRSIASVLWWERFDELPQPRLSDSPWGSDDVRRVARGAARLRRTSRAYQAVDESLLEARITGLITALDAAVRDGAIERFQTETAAAIRRRLASGFAPNDILSAVDEVERAVEELVVEHEAPQAVGAPKWRLIQRTLRHAERTALVGGVGTHATSDAQLAPREREVIAMLADGMRTQEIADHLSLSPLTIRTYVQRSMRKLGASTRTHAVALSIVSGAL
jgi:DNA-binding CsgD family transcriptional regulator